MNQTELLKGTLSTIILRLLEEKGRMYGYEITQLVKEMSGEKILLKEGSLYPALHKLEAEGLIIPEEEYIGKRVRKYYSLSKPGKKAAKSSVEELMQFMQMIQTLVTAKPTTSFAS